MKNIFIVMGVAFCSVFLSFKKEGGDKFTGTWFWRAQYFDDTELNASKGAVETQAINKITIKKDGERYLLTYDVAKPLFSMGGPDGPKQLTLVYTGRNDSLINLGGLGYVAFLKGSSHLLWNNQEWERPGTRK